ncbi:MAG: hypothetical protein MJ231_05030 [bacterium]|nr:hypothetical protein [bacterium]
MGLESIKVIGNTLKHVLKDGKVIFSESRVNYSGAKETLTVFYDPVQRKIVDGSLKVIKRNPKNGALKTLRQDIFTLEGYETVSQPNYRVPASIAKGRVRNIAECPGNEYYPLVNCQFFRENPDLFQAVNDARLDKRYIESMNEIRKSYSELAQAKLKRP